MSTTPHTHVDTAGRSPRVGGLGLFAAIVFVTVGVLQFLQGLAAILDDNFLVHVSGYVFAVDTTAWGWVHLVFGVICVLTGVFVVRGSLVARTIGIIVAMTALFINFLYLPYYPLWALVLIGLDVLVIWALAVADPE